jgi:predicted RNA-binding Zn-ribbon protein involved in translation (DUF1610 family)
LAVIVKNTKEKKAMKQCPICKGELKKEEVKRSNTGQFNCPKCGGALSYRINYLYCIVIVFVFNFLLTMFPIGVSAIARYCIAGCLGMGYVIIATKFGFGKVVEQKK